MGKTHSHTRHKHQQLCVAVAFSLRMTCMNCGAVCIRGLLYCMEYLEENLDEWLAEELEVPFTFTDSQASMTYCLWGYA